MILNFTVKIMSSNGGTFDHSSSVDLLDGMNWNEELVTTKVMKSARSVAAHFRGMCVEVRYKYNNTWCVHAFDGLGMLDR